MRVPAVVLLACGLALGDGGIVPEPPGGMMEYGQVAAVSHFDGSERLVLATRYQGEGVGFAWILPTPSLPAVDSVRTALFAELEAYCRPAYRRGAGFGCFGGEIVDGTRGGDSLGVEELYGGIIGDYQYEVLRVDVAESLVHYLDTNGYEPPGNAEVVFQHYLDRGWHYFTVARVLDSLGRYESGSVGIGLEFDSDSAVYPLYISRLGSEYSAVVLYVFAEHRLHFRGAELWFSGRVGPETFQYEGRVFDRPCRLTKLMKYFEPAQMEDVTLSQAPDDRDFRRVVNEYQWYGSFGPMLFLAGVLLVRRRRRS